MRIVLSIIVLFILLAVASPAQAIEDPFSRPNNKFGIHILFPSEIDDAAQLINSGGGEWGYVIVPIQSGDRDLEKWQLFMNKAREKKVTPIIRLATEGDYFNTKVWRRPREEDILDFANFLNSLTWPVKNRYVTVFNEVNRNDEWGGRASPTEYAELLSYSVTVLKSKNADFFVMNAGLDNASIDGNGAINKLTFLRGMQAAVPGVFNQIDGFVSHSYPNPAFSQPPSVVSTTSLVSFRTERSLVQSYTKKNLPVFITETGWSEIVVSDDLRAGYYREAFATVWNDPGIIAITPFLLRATGTFEEFSFVRPDGSFTKQYESYASLTKQKGKPSLNPLPSKKPSVLASSNTELPAMQFPEKKPLKISRSEATMDMLSWLFKL